MKMEAWQPGKMLKVSGTLVKTYEKGITIDDARGVRWFVTNDLVIGPFIAQPDGARSQGLSAVDQSATPAS
jgi:hypothetical protein